MQSGVWCLELTRFGDYLPLVQTEEVHMPKTHPPYPPEFRQRWEVVDDRGMLKGVLFFLEAGEPRDHFLVPQEPSKG